MNSARYTHAPKTGILYEPTEGTRRFRVNNAYDQLCHGARLPRSYASDGWQPYLLLHIACQLTAFALTLVGGIELATTHPLNLVKTLVIITSSFHAAGIVLLLFASSWFVFPTEMAGVTAAILAFFMFAFGLSFVQFTLTVRIDDVFKAEHSYLYGGIAAQTISFALMLACMIQLAANGGMSTRHPDHLVDRQTELASVRKGELSAF
jgi:hypothetical protein